MSAAEKPFLPSVPVQPAPSVHEVQPQPDLVPHGKPWWQKVAVPALARAQRTPGEDSQVDRIDEPFLSTPRLLSGKKRNATQPARSRADGIQRLSIALINQAVLDLLENGRHSSAAERWLLSPEFDRIHNLL